jgi:hypothetical protein
MPQSVGSVTRLVTNEDHERWIMVAIRSRVFALPRCESTRIVALSMRSPAGHSIGRFASASTRLMPGVDAVLMIDHGPVTDPAWASRFAVRSPTFGVATGTGLTTPPSVVRPWLMVAVA